MNTKGTVGYDLITDFLDDDKLGVNIYIDEVDGDYVYKCNGTNEDGYDTIDNFVTDGVWDYDETERKYRVADANYMIIKTFEKGESIKQPVMNKVSIIFPVYVYGRLQSILLSSGKYDLFTKLQGNIRTKDDFEVASNAPGVFIYPVEAERDLKIGNQRKLK